MTAAEQGADERRLYPPAVRELSATAVAVYATLYLAGPSTTADLEELTGAGSTAVRKAIVELRDRDCLVSAPDPEEPRRLLHQPTTPVRYPDSGD